MVHSEGAIGVSHFWVPKKSAQARFASKLMYVAHVSPKAAPIRQSDRLAIA